MKNNQAKIKSAISTRRVVFFSLVFLLILSFSLYMFFLGRTIFDLVDRKNAESETKVVTSRISDLELQVLEYNNKVTMQKAYELGFVNNNEPQFVSRKTTALLR